MIVVLFLSFVVAAMAGMVLIRWAHDHASRYRPDMPQRFHVGDVPRLGGGECTLWHAGGVGMDCGRIDQCKYPLELVQHVGLCWSDTAGDAGWD